MATLTAGADTDAYCSKCKLVLAHVIIAMKGSKPARVECKTCKGIHTYKANPPGTKKTTTKRAARSVASDYDNLMNGRDIASARRYVISERFTEQEVIDHKKFGLGLVQRVLSDKKVEVAFPDGARVLVHDR